MEIVSWQTHLFLITVTMDLHYLGKKKVFPKHKCVELVWPKCLSVLQVHRNRSGARTVYRLIYEL